MCVSWAELSYLELPEDPQYNSRVILNNVSGRATPGKMLTVTGPHGSGQEELMMILAKQSLPGLSQGDVTLNAVSINSCPDFYRKIGFLLMGCEWIKHIHNLITQDQGWNPCYHYSCIQISCN